MTIKKDMRPYFCPIPLIETKKIIEQNEPGTDVTILIKTLNSKDNLERMLSDMKYTFNTIEKEDFYEVSFVI